MPIGRDSRISRNVDVAHRELQEGSVLLHLGSGEYHGVNEVGRLVWDLLENERALDDVVKAVRERVDAPPPELEEDVLRFLDELRERNLIVVS